MVEKAAWPQAIKGLAMPKDDSVCRPNFKRILNTCNHHTKLCKLERLISKWLSTEVLRYPNLFFFHSSEPFAHKLWKINPKRLI